MIGLDKKITIVYAGWVGGKFGSAQTTFATSTLTEHANITSAKLILLDA